MSTSIRTIRLLLTFLLAGVLLIAALPAQAAEIRSGGEVVIAEGEVIDDDLIVSGETVIVNGRVTGDLIAGGSTIIVNGVVEGSALFLAQDVKVSGAINGSVYSTAYLLDLGEAASIGRNLYYGGYALNTAPGSEVSRSTYVGGYQMVHDGRIGQDLVVGLSALALNGVVGGDVRGNLNVDPNAVSPSMFMPAQSVPYVAPIQPGLSVSDSADIGGALTVQETVVTPTAEEPQARGILGLPEWVANRIGEFIGLLIIGGLIVYLMPRFLPELGRELQSKPLPSFGWGAFIAFVLFPVALLLGIALVVLLTLFFGFVTFGELVMGVLTLTSSFLGFLFVAYLFAAYIIAKIVVGYWAGWFILSRTSLDPARTWTQLSYLALGLLIFEALRAIPVLGFALAAVVMFFGLGAMFVYVLDWRRGELAPETKAVPAIGV